MSDRLLGSSGRRQRPGGWQPTKGLASGTVQVGTLTRTYWLAAAPAPGARLIVAVHGLGTNGKNMAAFTGLAQRAPAAGFSVVFPDGVDQVWDGAARLPSREEVDDAGFIRALIDKMRSDGTAGPALPFLVGISNGALFVEHLARHGLVRAAGIALVSGTTTRASRLQRARPAQACAVLSFQGTGDRVMPYEGGPIGGRGVVGWLTARRAAKRVPPGDARIAVAAETVAADWAEANGLAPQPGFESLPNSPGSLHVARLRWSEPGHPGVVLYRIEGGGHGWPGGPQQLPARLIGHIARDLDATAILLEVASALT